MSVIKLRIPINKKLLTEHYGDKCADYDKDCVVCQAWRTFEKSYYVEEKVNREALFKFIWSDDND
jgi:hypothetical protein